ncbi:SDR family oxidoreductase [Glycomyces dulcitolivorans]|uniref:SDR family oxidoreductase n=1 Tax=Glycomyces dulcitolivorans TaxID=2200759 RepID=UPI000DD40FA1|nr:SDR family oxidoreductase [Glycomyces dulcitolivorans]
MGQLTDATVLITGASRGIGAATAKLLAAEGAHVLVNYRDKAKRADAVVAAIEAAGGTAASVQADITSDADLDRLFGAVGELQVLVLNASGGLERDVDPDYAYRLNRDAQVALAAKALPLMPKGGRIVYVTSHQAHFADTTVDELEVYAPVARSKRAGEDALRAMLPEFTAQGVDFVTVSGDMIEGTITATLLERAQPGVIEQRREAAGGLLTVEEFAAHVADAAVADLPTGEVVLAGGPGAWA